MEKKDVVESCSNCFYNRLCGCPRVDWDIQGSITVCSCWRLSYRAYEDLREQGLDYFSD